MVREIAAAEITETVAGMKIVKEMARDSSQCIQKIKEHRISSGFLRFRSRSHFHTVPNGFSRKTAGAGWAKWLKSL